jgi:hypothetical protein
MPLLNRSIETVLQQLTGKYPVVTITGPRQSGKTNFNCSPVSEISPNAWSNPRNSIFTMSVRPLFYSASRMKGLNHFARVFPDHIPSGSGLVYGGEAAQKRTDVAIVSVDGLDYLWEMGNLM